VDLSVLFTDAPRAKSSYRVDTLESDVHNSEVQHSDAFLHFIHVPEDSTKPTKPKISSESTPSAILKSFFFSALETSLNDSLSLGFADNPDSINTETNSGTNPGI
jgi:hypothetical protein